MISPQFSLRELRERPVISYSSAALLRVLLTEGERLALVEAVEAAQAVRKRHPHNAESADLVLDAVLARFKDYGEAPDA